MNFKLMETVVLSFVCLMQSTNIILFAEADEGLGKASENAGYILQPFLYSSDRS